MGVLGRVLAALGLRRPPPEPAEPFVYAYVTHRACTLNVSFRPTHPEGLTLTGCIFHRRHPRPGDLLILPLDDGDTTRYRFTAVRPMWRPGDQCFFDAEYHPPTPREKAAYHLKYGLLTPAEYVECLAYIEGLEGSA